MPALRSIAVSLLLSLATAASAQDKPPQEAPQAQQNVFNPSVTVFSNVLWRIDNDDVIEDEDGEIIVKSDKFLLRETEVDFRAAVDPYADAVLIVAFEQEVPGEFELDVEEGYAVIKSLPFPIWEEPPLGTKLKVGRFLTSVGRHNRLHTHDLPQSQRGLTYENFVGEHGYIGNGVSAEMFLPSPGDSALTLTAEALQGGGWTIGEGGTERAAFVGNLRWSNAFGDEHNFDLSAIATYGSNDEEGTRQAVLYSADFLYKWKPLRQGEWSSIVVSGQAFYASQEFAPFTDPLSGLDVPSGTNRAFGYFAYAQYQIDRRWYVGVRYDWTEHLDNRDVETERLNPYISCYISEFFRLRAGYEHTKSDDKELDDHKTFLFELNIVFGAHPPHPYWVSY